MKIILLLVIALTLILSGCETSLNTKATTPEDSDYSAPASQAELDDLRQQVEQQQQTLNELQAQQEEIDRQLRAQRERESREAWQEMLRERDMTNQWMEEARQDSEDELRRRGFR